MGRVPAIAGATRFEQTDAFAADVPDAAVDDTTAGDVVQARTARLRREFKLTTDPLKNVADYPAFLEELGNLRYLERLSDQGILPKEKAPR